MAELGAGEGHGQIWVLERAVGKKKKERKKERAVGGWAIGGRLGDSGLEGEVPGKGTV